MSEQQSIKKPFSDAQIQELITEAETALTGITQGEWRVRSQRGLQSFVEAPEPPGRKFGYGIEVLGEDDNGYPTRGRDVELVAASPRLIRAMAEALKQLTAKPQPT